MHADKLVLPVIQIIGSYAYIKIKDTDRIDLFHPGIVLPQMKMLGDGLRHAIEHTFQIIKLAGILDLDKDDISLCVLSLESTRLNLSSASCWFPSLSNISSILICSPKNTVRKPSSTPKFAFCRSRRLMAQSKRIYRSCNSFIYFSSFSVFFSIVISCFSYPTIGWLQMYIKRSGIQAYPI